jgi:hypothetical protein
MTGTVVVAALAMAVGTALGVLVGRIVGPRLYRPSRLQPDGGGDKGKMGTMDKVLILEAVILVSYTVADLAVFWHTGSEPSTLTACVFGVCGFENGVMGWIKTNKDKAAEAAKTSGGGHQAAPMDPPTEREEPPNVGL